MKLQQPGAIVIRLTAIGDTIIASRAVKTLLDHHCQVVFVTHQSQADVAKSIPKLKYFCLIDEKNTLTLYSRSAQNNWVIADWAVLSENKFQIIDLQNTSRSRRAAKALQNTLHQKLKVSRVKKRTIFRLFLIFYSLLFWFQAKKKKTSKTIVRVHDLQLHVVKDFLRRAHITFRAAGESYLDAGQSGTAKKPFVLIFLGASYRLKVWPKEYVRKFIQRVLKTTQYDVVLCGGNAELKTAEFLEFDDGNRIKNLVGKTRLSETFSLAQSAGFILTNDSFGAHLADAFNIKAAVVFGATSPSFGFAPLSPNTKVFYSHLTCSPCSRHGQGECRFQNLNCLTEVSPEAVFDFFLTQKS